MQRSQKTRLESREESRAYKLFKRSINSPFTLKTYEKGLDQFCSHTHLTYDEIIKLDIEELQLKLEDWTEELENKGLRRGSIITHLNGVEKFLDINRKLYYKKPLHALIKHDKDLGGGMMAYTNDDIQKMLKAVSNKKRDVALIHFFASTGVRPQAIEDPILRMKHLIAIENCYAIRIYDKSPSGYDVFLSPEARQALDDYISSRKLNKENITLESPIFASMGESALHRHLTVNSAYQIIFKALGKANIIREKTGERWNKAIVYGFRKRYNTILKLNGDVNSNIAEKLMNHKRGLDGVYFTPTTQECFSEFKKAILDLTISDENRLKIQNTVKEKKIEELELKNQKIVELEANQREMSIWFEQYRRTHPDEFKNNDNN